MVYGLIKICADYMQMFGISFEQKLETGQIIDNALLNIKNAIGLTSSSANLSVKIDALLQKGHKCIRGEMGLSVICEIESILKGLSYEYREDNVKNNYLPLEVPADSDCAFHVLGTSREEGMALLLRHVKFPNRAVKAIRGDTQRGDVINIILDDLEIANNTRYVRNKENFEANVELAVEYLESLLKPGTWMPYNQNASSVLDALALLLNKNLRIFVANAQGKLILTSSNIHDQGFETIDMLCTSASGFSCDEKQFNHYIRLVKLPTQVIEITENNVMLAGQAKNVFFKPAPQALMIQSSLQTNQPAF